MHNDWQLQVCQLEFLYVLTIMGSLFTRIRSNKRTVATFLKNAAQMALLKLRTMDGVSQPQSLFMIKVKLFGLDTHQLKKVPKGFSGKDSPQAGPVSSAPLQYFRCVHTRRQTGDLAKRSSPSSHANKTWNKPYKVTSYAP